MHLNYRPRATKDIKKLSRPQLLKILKKLELLQKTPYLGKKLEGQYKGLRSLRAWPYRIIYEIKKKEIIIYSVKHRQGVYN